MDFLNEFYELIKEEKPSWLVKGVLTSEDEIYSFGTDTKILSRVFELLAYPYVKKIADNNNLTVELSTEQTVYPDFTIYDSKSSKKKIAVDVKSTYRKGNRAFGFTLGSYTSFLRNNTKNILYPADQYSEHWILGFIYDRDFDGSKSTAFVELKDRAKLNPPYKNIDFFVQ
ncbi:type II restriction endonuclease, partial [Candidatus Micrarchaeota archaeon]|nr:type II restriction endonuclease [Candidatus Micrarchaeota archaeon]